MKMAASSCALQTSSSCSLATAQCPKSRQTAAGQSGMACRFWLLLVLLLFVVALPACQCQFVDGQQQEFGQWETPARTMGQPRLRRLFRLAEVADMPVPVPAFYGQAVRQGAKRQMKDASPSLSAFTKMDAAMKNNMMRALINLRRYRRAASDEAGSDFQ